MHAVHGLRHLLCLGGRLRRRRQRHRRRAADLTARGVRQKLGSPGRLLLGRKLRRSRAQGLHALAVSTTAGHGPSTLPTSAPHADGVRSPAHLLLCMLEQFEERAAAPQRQTQAHFHRRAATLRKVRKQQLGARLLQDCSSLLAGVAPLQTRRRNLTQLLAKSARHVQHSLRRQSAHARKEVAWQVVSLTRGRGLRRTGKNLLRGLLQRRPWKQRRSSAGRIRRHDIPVGKRPGRRGATALAAPRGAAKIAQGSATRGGTYPPVERSKAGARLAIDDFATVLHTDMRQ